MISKGYLTIKENQAGAHVVEAQLVNGDLWLTQHEIAHLFNVFVSTISSNLRAIFKSGVLREEAVTRCHCFEHNGRSCEATLYNLEALIFVSHRIASLEAQAFRQWVMKAIREQVKSTMHKQTEVSIIFRYSTNIPINPLFN